MRKAFINFAQKHCQVLWARSHLRWTERQWKRVLWSDESIFQRFLGENYTCQRWKRLSRLLPTKGAKTSLCDGMGVHQCLWHGWSAHMWIYHWCGGLCWNFGETYAVVKTITFPRNSMFISAGQCQASFCTSYKQRGFIGIEGVCLTGLPTIQICLLLKMYSASWRGESDTATTDSWAAQVLYTPRIEELAKIPLVKL